MGFKCELLALFCALVHIGSISTIELTVTCNIIANDYCFIDKFIQLEVDDTLKFIVENPETIKSLDIIDGSKLVTLPTGIFETFPSMEKLFVSDLKMSLLQSDRFHGADKLRILNIYNNQIKVIPSKVFISLSNLVEMLLMDNIIETIEDNAFDGMVNLDTLKLENNRITTLRRLIFTGAPKIRVLHLDNNNIETIEEGALSLPNLELLHLAHNKLTTLSDTVLIAAPNLQQISLDYNAITHVRNAFSELKKLTVLRLSNNPVEDVSLSSLITLENLNSLYLGNTKYKLPQEIPSSGTTKSKLKVILLSGNSLSNPDILKHLSIFSQLEEIYLMNNTLSTLNDIDKIRNLFPQIRRMGLWNNEPTVCNWIEENEVFLKDISVWSTSADGMICRSADYKFDISNFRE